jgi:hypothetical protein
LYHRSSEGFIITTMVRPQHFSRDFIVDTLQIAMIALVIGIPFSVFLTVWIAGAVDIKLSSAWNEVMVAVLAFMALYLFLKDSKLRNAILARKINLLIGVYFFLHLAYIPFSKDYFIAFAGMASNVRFLICFLIVQVIVFYRNGFGAQLQKVILSVSAVVAGLGIVQALLLPKDFLRHFGYEIPGATKPGVPPAYHMVANSGLVRAQSILRGPNVLGAYLILPLTAAVATKKIIIAFLFGLTILLSYSRSAWLGAFIAIAVVGICIHKKRIRSHGFVVASLIGLMILLGSILALNTSIGRQLVLHDTGSSTIEDSNAGHLKAFNTGVADIISQPMGSGPGSAGPVSALTGYPRIAENYFIQVTQETGWFGGVLLLAIHMAVIKALLSIKNDRKLTAIAAFCGLILTNLLLHTWADEAVAITFWMYAGAVMAEQ